MKDLCKYMADYLHERITISLIASNFLAEMIK